MRFSLRPKRIVKLLTVLFILGCFLVPAPPLASAYPNGTYSSNNYGQCAYGRSCPVQSSGSSTSKTSAATGATTGPSATGNESGQLTITPGGPQHKGLLHGHNCWWWFFLFLILFAIFLFFFFLLAARRRKDDDDDEPPSSTPVPPTSTSPPGPGSHGVVVG